AVTALKLSKAGVEFITTPAPATSSSHRSAKLTLSTDGSLKGEISLELKGEEALQHRLDALKTDEAGRRKNFEDEVQAWISGQAIVKLKDSSGWEDTEGPLVAHFAVEAPNFAATGGKRLITPVILFPTFGKNMFRDDSRKYPIVFPYPFTENDETDIQ